MSFRPKHYLKQNNPTPTHLAYRAGQPGGLSKECCCSELGAGDTMTTGSPTRL